MYFDVEVTAEDIKNGLKGYFNKCPLALASRRTIGSRILVSSEFFYYKSMPYDLTKKAKEFVRRFDSGKSVKPDVFRLFIK